MLPRSSCCGARSWGDTGLPGLVPLACRDGSDTEAEGNPGGALDLLNEAERLYIGDFFPNVRPIPALRARVWIVLGNSVKLSRAWRQQGLSVEDDLSYLREFEHITLARVLLARYQAERAEHSITEATRLLERLLSAAEEGGRTGRVIEILVLRRSPTRH